MSSSCLAGYGHKKIDASKDYANYGAYPGGIDFDMNYGKAKERPQTIDNIAQVPLPDYDPVFGQGVRSLIIGNTDAEMEIKGI